MSHNRPFTPPPIRPGTRCDPPTAPGHTLDAPPPQSDLGRALQETRRLLIQGLYAIVQNKNATPAQRAFAVQSALSFNEDFSRPEAEVIRQIITACYRSLADPATSSTERALLLQRIRLCEQRLQTIQP